MKGTIVLSRKEAHRGHVLEQVDQQALTLKEAAAIMGVSYRQARRLRQRWLKAGLAGLSHRNRGRPAHNALPPQTAAVILAFHDQLYSDFNDSHFTELLA